MGTNYYWEDNLVVVEGKLVEVDPLDEISSRLPSPGSPLL